jgi:hypothetical protein
MLRPDPEAKTDNRDERQQPNEKHYYSNRSRHFVWFLGLYHFSVFNDLYYITDFPKGVSTPAAIAGVKRCAPLIYRVTSV